MQENKVLSPTLQHDLYKFMFEALPEPMFLADRNKNILGVFNFEQKYLGGMTAGELIGMNILDFIRNPSSPFCAACLLFNEAFDRVLATGSMQRFQYTISEMYVEATVVPLPEGQLLTRLRNISDTVCGREQFELSEQRRRRELSMALVAGGLTSWSYHVQEKFFTSSSGNNVIGHRMSFERLFESIVPEYRQLVGDMLDGIIHRGDRQGHVTVRVYNLNGEVQWSDVHAIPMEYDPEGNVSLIAGLQKIVTREFEDRERLYNLLRQNELILNNSSSGFVFLRPDRVVEWENVSTTFAYADLAEYFRTGVACDAAILREMCACSIDGDSLNMFEKQSHIFRTSCGAILEVLSQPVLDAEGGMQGVVLHFDDVTDREMALQELARAKEHAEQSDRLKSAFLANMSHEIRTPLNSIVGFSQLVSSTDDREERQGYAAIVSTHCDQLLNLVDDIIDLSKIEAGDFTPQNTIFDLPDLFREMEGLFRHKVSPEVNLFCDLSFSPFDVKFDRVRIAQILSNFVSNAVKFTRKGHIRMGFHVAQGGVKLFVEDTGCGIGVEHVGRVFDRFEKLNSFEQGTGLGTSIAKAIVDIYGGQIGVESKPGHGSTFWALLPLSDAQSV